MSKCKYFCSETHKSCWAHDQKIITLNSLENEIRRKLEGEREYLIACTEKIWIVKKIKINLFFFCAENKGTEIRYFCHYLFQYGSLTVNLVDYALN